MKDLVSIVIPCYNYAHYLRESVQSAVKQTYPNIEIIIVNDGSPDNTEEVARSLQMKYPKIIKVINQKNSGVSEARNNGIRNATGTFILPLDADDILDSDMVSMCIERLKTTCSDIVYVGYRRIGIMGGEYIAKSFSDASFLFIAPFGPGALFGKHVWEVTGGYKNNMKESYEDWEFWLNAYKNGFKIQHLPEILFSYRKQEESRFVQTYRHHDYAKSIIVMNHPELYTKYHIQNAIQKIREEENLSDLYFYYDANMPKDHQQWFEALSKYLYSFEHGQCVTINLLNKKVGLCLLDDLDAENSIIELYEKLDVDFIIFYSNIRYDISQLKSYDLAWEMGQGLTKCEGTIFPFVFKQKREEYQETACARQSNYFNRFLEPENLKLKELIAGQKSQMDNQKSYINDLQSLAEKRKDLIYAKDDLLERRKDLIHKKDDLLERRKDLILTKDDLLEKRKLIIDNQTDTLQKQEQLISSIENITKTSVFKSPVKKYKAYKNMLVQYYRYKK